MAGRVSVDWLTCDEYGCIGIRLDTGDKCLAHAGDEERDAALKQIAQTSRIDARGVTISSTLLAQILDEVPRDPNGHAMPAEAQFGWVTFQGDADFSWVTFQGDAWFREASFQGSADFSGATFAGTARFDGASFDGDVRFGGTTFKCPVVFAGATFEGPARFDGAIFKGSAGFQRVAFKHYAEFGPATFKSPAEFGGASFRGEAGFDEATFEDFAGFQHAAFKHFAAFGQATFKDHAEFGQATFKGEARFHRAAVKGYTHFGQATFEGYAGFNRATFQGFTQFGWAIFEDYAEFNEARFEGDVSVLGPVKIRGQLYMDGVQFASAVRIEADASALTCRRGQFSGSVRFDVRRAVIRLDESDLSVPSLLTRPPVSDQDGIAGRPKLLSLQGINVPGLTLGNVSLADCRFAGAHNLDRLRLQADTVFGLSPAVAGWERRQV